MSELIEGQEYSPHKLFMGIFIPISLVQSGLVSPGALLVFGRLALYLGANDKAWPKVETLARELKHSTHKVTRWMAELVSNRLIKRIQRGAGLGAECTFIWHQVLEPSLASKKRLPTPPATANIREQLSRRELAPTANLLEHHEKEQVSATANMRENETPASANMREQTTANLQCPYKEEKIQSEKIHLKDSSSSSVGSSAVAGNDEEEDENSISQKTGPETGLSPHLVVPPAAVQHSEEDIEEFGEHMRDSLVTPGDATERYASRYMRQERAACPREFVLEILAGAPGWTTAESWQALKDNSKVRRSKPETYAWFKTTLANLYADRKGVPPRMEAQR